MKCFNKLLASAATAAVLSLMPSLASAQNYYYEETIGPDHRNALAFSVGYINKDWVTEMDGKTYHENFWGEPDKRLHGIQMGATYQSCLNFGLGLKTGLFMEFCTSYSDFVEEMGWDSYNEYSLYLPLHVVWNIPITHTSSITPFAGLGFNWAMYGTFEDNWRYDYQYQSFGNGYAPKRWNNQLEFGADVFINSVKIGFTYSKGIRDHEVYDGLETYQNKIAINIGFCL